MTRINEARTRKEYIDPELEKAGWSLRDKTRVGIEIPVDGYNAEPWNGITDYCLFRRNGEVLAVVEAKRTSHDPRLAQQQAEHYIMEIGKKQSFNPFVFLTNGLDIYFWDVDSTAKRLVFGFFSSDDLERLLWIKQNKKPLENIVINQIITDRIYQYEAIRRVNETFQKGRRKALIVMATGTGKTRTTMSLIDVFLRANQARNILFVADRDELVKQAKTDGFERFMPHEPCTRIYSNHIEKSNRLYTSTLQTLSNCFESFTPGFFDLVIFDEVHRSIFNKYNEVIQYFDARMVGLTATPAQFIDRDTFRTFECFDGKPTFLYPFEDAVKEEYLVNYTLFSARTRFQNFGIRGVELTEEQRNNLIEQGIDPDELDFEGTQLEKDVSNRDTLRKQWEELIDICIKDQSGQLPGKTIIFAITQEHALRLQETFDEMYPQWQNLCRVITHKSEYRGLLMDKFKKDEFPRIAISVDMLDTGVDIPEVVNLVFMKQVQSRIKLEQMIGRGTRSFAACRPHLFHLLPDGKKDQFLIIDFWDNQFNRSADEVTTQTMPVLVALFNTRLKLLETYLDSSLDAEKQFVISDLRRMISRIPKQSFSVKRVLPEIEMVWEDSYWAYLVPSKLEFLRLQVAPLLRLASDVDVPAETFTHKIERLRLLIRLEKNTESLIDSILEDVAMLPDFVLTDPAVEPVIHHLNPHTMQEKNTEQLIEMRNQLSGFMKNKRKQRNFLTLDLHDIIDRSGYILLTNSGEQVYITEYRQRIESRILALVKNHPTLIAIAQGQTIQESALIELERTLVQDLAEGGLEASPLNLRKVYGVQIDSFLDLLRIVLDMDAIPGYREVVSDQFRLFINQQNFNADQMRFIRAVQSVFLQKRHLVLADFYQEPLSNFGADAVDRWFDNRQVQELLDFVQSLEI